MFTIPKVIRYIFNLCYNYFKLYGNWRRDSKNKKNVTVKYSNTTIPTLSDVFINTLNKHFKNRLFLSFNINTSKFSLNLLFA